MTEVTLYKYTRKKGEVRGVEGGMEMGRGAAGGLHASGGGGGMTCV